MSRTTGALKHTHQYFKSRTGKGKVVWRCMKDGCTHFWPGNMGEDGPIGYNSDCWECRREFMLSPYLMSIDRPVCDECREKVDARPSEELITGITELNRMLRLKGYATIFDAPKEQVRMWMLSGKITQEAVDKLIEVSTEEDVIEVIEPEDN